MNHLINLLVVISLLLGSATPGLAFGGVGQSRAASGWAQEGGAGSQTPVASNNEGTPTQPAAEPSLAWLRLTATASPNAAAPGEVVMLAWQVENLGGQAAGAGAELTAEMPAGVVVQSNQVEPPLAYDPAAQRITWEMGEIAAGETLTATAPVRVTGRRVGEVVEIVAELRAADGGLLDASAATVQITPPLPTATRIGPEGGVVSLEDGRVTLSFAPGAVAADVTVLARALGRPEKAPANIERAYEFSVKGANGEDIHTFGQPLKLAVRHPEGQPEAGRLFVLEEASGDWQMLATQWDAEQGALVAEVPHLSQTAEGNNFVPEVMPSLRGVQSDLFSGGASYDYPIAAPPGTGGLTPQVGLQFSSRSRWEDLGHASVTGAGWKLTSDSFRYWRPWDTANGSAPTMRVEGAAFSEISGANGERTFKEEPQWRVVGDPTSATTTDVYGPNGVRYHFEAALHDWYCQGTTWQQRTDKWVLQYIVDQAGNRINYTYDTAVPVDPINVNSNYAAYGDRVRMVRIASACSNNGAGGNQDIRYLSQINLTRISYNSLNGVDQSVIDFSYTITRTDSALANANDTSSWAHATTRLLTGIAVKQAGALVASYKLDYDFFDKPLGGGDNERLYALRSIRRCSDAGMTNCLPATLFSNTRSQMRRIDNGYGGQVGLGYGLDSIVTSRTITDTVTGSAQTWTYTYANRLDGQGGSLAGYRSVTETLPSSLGTGNWSYHHFRDNGGGDEFVGKEDQVTVAANNIKQAETLRTWVSTSNGVYGGGKFVVVSAETQNTYDKDGANPLARKTEYFYDLDHQGNAQYGNLTRIKEYSDSGATLYRTSERWYNPQVDMAAGRYIVDRLAEEKLWTRTSVCMSQARWIYDVATPGFDQHLATFAKGWLKEQWQATVCGSGAASDWVRQAAYGYDGKGNVNSVTAANGTATTTVYDATFSVYPLSVTVTPAAGLGGATLTTSYAYYGLNAEPGGSGLTGQLQKATDPNGAVTRTSYDALGRPLELRRPGAGFSNPATAKIAYTDAIPFKVKQSQRDDANGDADANATYLESYSFYDGLGQTLQTQAEGESAGAPAFVSSQYNALGAVIGQSVPYTGTVLGTYAAFDWASPPQAVGRSEYDGLGRETKATLPDGSVVNTVYNGRKTAVLEAMGRQSLSEVDAFGRLVSSKQYTGSYVKNPPTPGWNDPSYATASYFYNERDQLESVSGPDGAATDPTYNLLGQKTQMVDPDLGTWTYAYDAAGNLTRQTDAKNQRVCFYYDGHNRLKGKTYSTGTAACPTDPGYTGYTIKYYYDVDENGAAVANGKGRRTVMIDPSGSAKWLYGQRGKVTQETKVIGGAGGGTFVTKWSYDAAGRPVWQKYPADNAGGIGEQVNYAYTNQGLLDTVIGTATYVGDTLWNVRGQVSERWLGSATGVLKQLYAYTTAENFRLVGLRAGTNAGANENLQKLSYTYDDNGNVLAITDAAAVGGSQTQTFTYDALNRLSTAQATGGSNGVYGQVSYSYSSAGNLTNFEGTAFTYQDAAHKHAVTHLGGVQKYWYDANGNASRRINGSKDVTLSYDGENRLLDISGSVGEMFVYDGDGNRVKEVTATAPVQYQEDFSDDQAQGWAVGSGTWGVAMGSGVYRQSTTNTNTNTYLALPQASVSTYQWTASYTSGTQAGLYLFASSNTGSERGNSYRVWQDGANVSIYESAANVSTLRASFSAANAAGQTHSYKVTYDPQTGKFDLWRDGVYLGMWQDATPLTTGAYISLRTDASDVLFDNLVVNDYHFTRTFVGSHYEKMTTQEDFGDGQAQGWTAASGTWAVSGGGYRQSTTNTNTNAYQSQGQNTALSYEWTAMYTSGTQAGLYLFASAATGAERGNSYRVWQDATHVRLYENASNVATLLTSFAAANALGQAHSYKVSYDPQTGKFDLWRDGVSLGTWTDTSSPLTTGGYISLRTDASNVLFDNIVMTRESKYYEAGGVRVAVRHNTSTAVSYLLSDHLGSTSVTANTSGAYVTELRYYAYGGVRYNPGNQITTYRYTGQRWDSGTSLYYYSARWYDPAIGRFLAADTIVPEPGNPQSLNRYSYVGNNPLRYVDPTGHDWVDALDFLYGFGAQLASANTWMAPQAQEALAAQPNESVPMIVGRHLGNVAAVLQGLAEVGGGATVAGGGAAVCLTGVGCVAGAPLAAIGVAAVAHGGSVAIAGAAKEGQMLGDLVAQVRAGNKVSTEGHHPWPKYLGGPKKQPLLDLPAKLHQQYHTGLDKLWSRFDGSKIWSQLSVKEQQEIISGLRDYSRRFDAENGTATLEALEKAFKEAGVVP